MPREGFQPEEDVRSPVNPDELRLVLHDLSHDEVEEERAGRDLPPDHVTAEAISEVLGIPINDVYAAIKRVRRHELREHVSRVLSELEEPTHLVERPGFGSDPLLNNYNYRRENVFSDVLDTLPQHEQPQAPPKTELKPSLLERVITYLFLTGLVATVAYAAIQIAQQLR